MVCTTPIVNTQSTNADLSKIIFPDASPPQNVPPSYTRSVLYCLSVSCLHQTQNENFKGLNLFKNVCSCNINRSEIKLDFSDTTVKEILPTYNKAEPRRNQYCQSSMIKSQNGIVYSVILLSFTNATAEHIIKIGTGLYILKPKYSDSGDLMEYPVSYVKAKNVNTATKADGNVFVLRAVIVCYTALSSLIIERPRMLTVKSTSHLPTWTKVGSTMVKESVMI